jgi:hypothetical protein
VGFRPDKDDAGRQFDPAEIPSCAAIQPPGDAAELSQERMSAFDRAAYATYPPRPRATPLGCLHPKAGRCRPGRGRAIPVSAIGTGPGQVTRVGLNDRDLRRGRLDDHRLENGLRLYPVVGTGLGHDRPQRQAAFLGR